MLARVRLTLGDSNYRVLLWHFGHGLSQRQIARRLGITQQAVAERIGRATRDFPALRHHVTRRRPRMRQAFALFNPAARN